jgi:NAD(P)-dependent dehydrogenase (short-subunit alcohol dehydrogenase family)
MPHDLLDAGQHAARSAGWRDLMAATVASRGAVAIVVNNAGIAIAGDTPSDMDENDRDRITDINARGVRLGMKYVLPVMLRRGLQRRVDPFPIGLRDAAASCSGRTLLKLGGVSRA